MCVINKTKVFHKAVKRLKRSGKYNSLSEEIETVIDMLATGQRLHSAYRDHQLKGDLSSYRECHIRNDVLLLYRIDKNQLILVLFDIGSHSYFFE